MENNFVIDYAKTLYKPTRPNKINNEIIKFTNKKVPYFFIYAKDKEVSQVEQKNESIVNKLDAIIPNVRINTRKIGLGKIDYKLLMNDVNIEIDEKLIAKYEELSETYHFKISMKDEYQSNLHYLACEMRKELNSFGYDEVEITDMLVKYLYGDIIDKKEVLWFCYGKYIVDNLKMNVPIKKTKLIQCVDCGEWLEIPIESKSERCEKCQYEYRKEWNRQRMRKKRSK